MKIGCGCGATIYDNTDYLPWKAHVISDQDWFVIWEEIDKAVEESGSTAKEKEQACMRLRNRVGEAKRLAWQGSSCGRVYVDDKDHTLQSFVPESDEVSKEIFFRWTSPTGRPEDRVD